MKVVLEHDQEYIDNNNQFPYPLLNREEVFLTYKLKRLNHGFF